MKIVYINIEETEGITRSIMCMKMFEIDIEEAQRITQSYMHKKFLKQHEQMERIFFVAVADLPES